MRKFSIFVGGYNNCIIPTLIIAHDVIMILSRLNEPLT